MTGRYQRAVDLLELLTLLQEGPTGFSTQQIADHFKVSRRTAERMLSVLRQRFPELQPELRRGRKFWRFVPSGRALADWRLEPQSEHAEGEADAEGREPSLRRSRWLVAAAQPRDGLAGTIADALRAPVASVLLIGRSALEPDEEDSKEALERIVALAERMEHTIERALQFVRREPLKREPSSPGMLLQCVADEVRSAAAASDVAIELVSAPDLPSIEVDRSLLGSALSDLALNAIEAMPKGGRLTLRAEALPDRESVRVSVEDTGAGIHSGDEEWIFEPFYTTKHAGTGLGLTMVKEIAAEHGASVRVSVGEVGGAVLSMEIPRSGTAEGLDSAPKL